MSVKPRWGVALLASLAVNIALIGFVIGTAVRPVLAPRPFFDPSVGIAELLRHLPRERSERLLADLAAEGTPWRRPIRASARGMRRAQRALHEALIAERFDERALATALADFRAHFATNQERSHMAFTAIAGKLTPTERRQFVASLDDTRRRARRRRGVD